MLCNAKTESPTPEYHNLTDQAAICCCWPPSGCASDCSCMIYNRQPFILTTLESLLTCVLNSSLFSWISLIRPSNFFLNQKCQHFPRPQTFEDHTSRPQWNPNDHSHCWPPPSYPASIALGQQACRCLHLPSVSRIPVPLSPMYRHVAWLVGISNLLYTSVFLLLRFELLPRLNMATHLCRLSEPGYG